jgi:hypothetical protein
MKTNLLLVTVATLLSFPTINFAQAPTLGVAANFVLFSTNGAVSNTGISQLTGNVGTNNGSSTAFGNVNGIMHDQDTASAKCATDLLTAYNLLNGTTQTGALAPALGTGQTLIAGVYNIPSAATLNGDLILDGKNNSGSVFIFKIQAPFSTSTNSKVKLINGALACNVFWKVEGLVDIAAGTSMKGTIIANNAAIQMATGDTLEGRALSTAGAISVNGVLAYTPIGCGSLTLTGPTIPTLGSASCFAIFSSNGSVSNTLVTKVKGDIGTNVGTTSGFLATDVTGTIHPGPDGTTGACAADLLNAYTNLNLLAPDIELLYPVQFGNNLVLTPHTYVMKTAATFTDTLYLNAQNNANATFVIKVNGILSTSTHSKVVLLNKAQASNVYWVVEGAVNIKDYSVFNGTIVSHQGAINLFIGAKVNGRALTTGGAISTAGISDTISSPCLITGILSQEATNKAIAVFPNPFSSSVTFRIADASQIRNCELRVYNVLGAEVITTPISKETTTLETAQLPSGVYFYKITGNGTTIQTGRLVSRQ